VPFASTEKFKKSFLPSTIKFWNTLPEQLRNSSSVDSFRNNLTRDLFYVPPANKLFNLGDRYLNILHTRLRLKNCALNYYLYLMNCIESPSCICGEFKEDVTHYLMFCPCFAALRDSMLSGTLMPGSKIVNSRKYIKICKKSVKPSILTVQVL
jgi:hypothetical protein